MITEKNMIAIAKMFCYTKLNVSNYTKDKLFMITEELEEIYDYRQLNTLGLSQISDVLECIDEYIRRETLIAKQSGVYSHIYAEEIDRKHNSVILKINKKISFIKENLEDEVEKYFIETAYHKPSNSYKSYYITKKGKLLLEGI